MGGLWQDRRAAALAAAGLGLVGREVLARLREADLSGQVALIMGGSRGLGLLLARELAGEGCRIAICARDEAELERARADLEGRGAEVLAARCDVADRAQVERLVRQATERFGRVDILVNSAGVIQVGPVQTMTLEDYEESLGIMFWGTVYPTLAVLPQMLERRAGRIVNITSIGGKVSVPHLVPYACAKFAAVGFSQGLRAELAREGITVTTIVPGLMRTGSGFNAFFKGQQEREFTLFALVDTLPFVSLDAERAARQIVTATKRGQAERILTIPANLAARFNGLFPGLTADLLGLANRLLPGPDGSGTARARGMAVHERVRSPLLDRLLGWNLSAARRFNEYPGPLSALASTSLPGREDTTS